MVEKIHKGMNKCINTKSKNGWRMNIMMDERLDVEMNKLMKNMWKDKWINERTIEWIKEFVK